MEHAFLKNKNSGVLQKMKGNVVACYILIDTPGAEWDKPSQKALAGSVIKASAFLTDEASKRGIYLNIKSIMRPGSLPHSISVNDDRASRDAELANSVKYPDLNSLRTAYKAKYAADAVMLCFAFREDGRSFANIEYAVIFGEAAEGTAAHELCHICGAQDLYYPTLIREKAKQHFGKSLMLHSADMVMDPLTAYLIGWDESPDSTAEAFLRDTASLTGEQLTNARKGESKTGHGTVCRACGVYNGELKDGSFNGFGIMEYTNGDCYIGEWKHGKENGRGTCRYRNGDRYEGEWRDGRRNGKGTYYFSDGRHQTGVWKNGERIGQKLR